MKISAAISRAVSNYKQDSPTQTASTSTFAYIYIKLEYLRRRGTFFFPLFRSREKRMLKKIGFNLSAQTLDEKLFE